MNEVYTARPLSPLRKVIAARMSEAKRTIPHFRVVADIELDTLLTWRARVNDSRPECKVSVNDCIVKGCAAALMQHRGINVQFVGEEIHEYADADVSIVIAVPGGLSTPVIRSANRKSLHEIATETKALAARAAANQLKMAEIVGGSFSISNLGSYEVAQFDAIINPPQCAILAVGCAKPRVVVSESGGMHIATLMRVSLSVDHRVIDGVAAAKFLSTLRATLERPDALAETC